MSIKKPKIPLPAPTPTPATPPTSPSPTQMGTGSAVSSTFDKFSFAPELAGFVPPKTGRRSLIGG